MITLSVNGRARQVDVEPDTPLLWALRDGLHLTGTKYGCGVAQCGACTVHLDGQPVRACVTPVSAVGGRAITTIEGLHPTADHPSSARGSRRRCPSGYCQSGQIMSAAALLARNPRPTDRDIDDAMAGNICRCGTYQRIRRAIHQAASAMRSGASRRGDRS